MDTNKNLYTVVYTAVVVLIVSALLAFVSTALKDKQDANEKADIMGQIMTAAQFGTRAELQGLGNSNVLAKFDEELAESFTVNLAGEKVADLQRDKVYPAKELKAQNYKIKGAGEPELPVFIFKNGKTVVPIYGAGLWGPIWGYIAFEEDLTTIASAYFDHDSETAGLGARIKDDPDFQHEFNGEKADFAGTRVFEIVKGGAPKEADGKTSVIDNKIDAITGATMTCKGLDEAINTWLGAYRAYFGKNASTSSCCGECAQDCGKCSEGCDEAENNCGEE